MGASSFEPPVDFAMIDSPISIATGDFNADARPDLAVVHFQVQGRAVVLLNTTSPFERVFASGFE